MSSAGQIAGAIVGGVIGCSNRFTISLLWVIPIAWCVGAERQLQRVKRESVEVT